MSVRTLLRRLDPRVVRATVPLCIAWAVPSVVPAAVAAWRGLPWAAVPWALLAAWWLVALAYSTRDSLRVRRAAR